MTVQAIVAAALQDSSSFPQASCKVIAAAATRQWWSKLVVRRGHGICTRRYPQLLLVLSTFNAALFADAIAGAPIRLVTRILVFVQQTVTAQARWDSHGPRSVRQQEALTACAATTLPVTAPIVTTQWYFYVPSGATIVGDPHITTFDGQRYTLLSQGTFSLWHFSGVETDFHSEEIGGTKKLPIDWQVYAHYAGRQSFTKGLLLIDRSGGSMRQMLEITSQDCKWKTRKGNEEWTVVDPAHNAEISVPDGGEYVTGFDLSRTVTAPHGHRFPNRVRFNMNTKDGKSDIAVLSLSCRPNHNINVQMSMKRKSDEQFVDGELKVARKSLSMLQTSTDSEFRADSKWEELGGSKQAALYLQLVDESRTSVALLQSHGCGDTEKDWATQTCSKHLGKAHGTEDAEFLEDCIYDLCHGAGETQAELAAELLATTKAD
eukprot:s1072_g7.t1